MSNTIFDSHGVSVTVSITGDDIEGRFSVHWEEYGNRMLNIFEFSGLVSHRKQMAEALKFAAVQLLDETQHT